MGVRSDDPAQLLLGGDPGLLRGSHRLGPQRSGVPGRAFPGWERDGGDGGMLCSHGPSHVSQYCVAGLWGGGAGREALWLLEQLQLALITSYNAQTFTQDSNEP